MMSGPQVEVTHHSGSHRWVSNVFLLNCCFQIQFSSDILPQEGHYVHCESICDEKVGNYSHVTSLWSPGLSPGGRETDRASKSSVI